MVETAEAMGVTEMVMAAAVVTVTAAVMAISVVAAVTGAGRKAVSQPHASPA